MVDCVDAFCDGPRKERRGGFEVRVAVLHGGGPVDYSVPTNGHDASSDSRRGTSHTRAQSSANGVGLSADRTKRTVLESSAS